jgi:hypothetical protein
MKDLSRIGEDLFQKIRGRFPNVTIGDEEGNVTNEPTEARFFDFDYKSGERKLGKVSVSISEDEGLSVIYSRDFIQNEDKLTQKEWYNFLKELRKFSKKRLLNFDVRDITKSNLTKRDYKFLAANRSGDETMNESKLYGTGRVSYQNVDGARIVIKHNENINQEIPAARTRNIGSIYIESTEGERFKYPYRHLSGARAMARHVAEGGKPYDSFGSHITTLSEEMWKLRKFKNYVGRSNVMAESLAGYMDVVKERVDTIRKTINGLQNRSKYQEAIDSYETPVFEDVPDDVKENWVDQLTIRQFNEELKDVFPYIYRLVGEATRAKELGPEDLIDEDDDPCWKNYKQVGMKKKNGKEVPNCVPESDDLDESGLQYHTGVKKHGKEYMKKAAQAGRNGASQEELGRLRDKYSKAEKQTKEEFELEQAFEDTMGQFADVCKDCGNPSWRTFTEAEKQKGLDGKACWKGYRRQGTKMKGGKRVDNCVKVGESEDEIDEAEVGTVYMRFRDRETPSGDSYLTAFAGFANSPAELKMDSASRKYMKLTTKEDIIKAVKDVKNDKVFVGAKDITVFVDNPMLSKKYDHFDEALDVLEKFGKQQGITVQYKDQDPTKKREKGSGKKRLPKGHAKSAMKNYKDAESETTKYFSIDNNRLMSFLRKSAPQIMNSFRPNLNQFVMDQAQYRKFRNWLNSEEVVSKFGETQVRVDKEKSFSQDKGREFESTEQDANNSAMELMGKIRKMAKGIEQSSDDQEHRIFAQQVESALIDLYQMTNSEEVKNLIRQNKSAQRDTDRRNANNIATSLWELMQSNQEEGNAYANAVRQAKMNGKKKGDKVQGPDGDEITLEKEQQTPISEFILSYFDYTTGQFPKGETAVLTMIEKDYGEEFIEPAKAFIERINERVSEVMGYREPDIQEDDYELNDISRLAGI